MNGGRLALWWVDRYTRGLPEATRADRHAEVASDVWEHRASAGDTRAAQLAIASRCVRGMPADLSWRRSRAGRRLTVPGRGQLLRGLGWAIAGIAYTLLVLQHAWFATALLGFDFYGDDWAPGDVAVWSRIAGGFVVVLLGGAVLLRAAPRCGAALLTGGAFGTAALMWWALPILGPVAVAVTTAAVTLARRRRRALRAPAVSG